MITFAPGDFAMTTRSPNGGGPVCVGPLHNLGGRVSSTNGLWQTDGTPEYQTSKDYGPLTQVARPWGDWVRGPWVTCIRCDSDPCYAFCAADFASNDDPQYPADALFIPCDPEPAAKVKKWTKGTFEQLAIAVAEHREHEIRARYRNGTLHSWRIVGDGE